MSDSLLSYFEQELRFIRDEASLFVERHPGAARALGMRKDSIDDPQVARLIESVALMNGRLQQRLDESYPELTESLVNLLFPHYLRPVPSYTMLDFNVLPDAGSHKVQSLRFLMSLQKAQYFVLLKTLSCFRSGSLRPKYCSHPLKWRDLMAPKTQRRCWN